MRPLWFGTCPTTGKRCYPSRKVAKRANRQLQAMGGHDGHMNAYPCPDVSDGATHFHIGHLPTWVADGSVSRNYLKRKDRPA